MTINTFIAHIILQIKFDILTFYFHTNFIENIYRTTNNFHNIALFKKNKTTNHRQQRQLIKNDKIFTHPQTNHQRTTKTYRQQNIQITKIHNHYTVHTTQLQNNTQNNLTQNPTLFQLPIHQINNHFNIDFKNENITTHF